MDIQINNQEKNLLLQVATGYSTKEMAQNNLCSKNTINNRLTILRYKLGAKNKAHLVYLAFHSGILQ